MNDCRCIRSHRRRSILAPAKGAAIISMGFVGFLFATAPGVAAHTETRPTPGTLWAAWEFDPVVAAGLLLMTWLYLRGTADLWRRAGAVRGVRRWQVAVFVGGIVIFALARFSPLDALGGALFSAHMVQHLLVFLVAPVLFAASGPLLPMMWAIPTSWRRAVVKSSSMPAVGAVWHVVNHWFAVLILYGGVLWIWHMPRLYDAALESQLVHGMEHATFAGLAFLFWSCLLEAGRPNGIGHGLALLMVFVTALHSGALGALLTFARFPMYTSHEPYTLAWGLTPLEDQQLAGVLMWVPMGIWFAATGLILLASWIRAADRSVRQWESGGSDGLVSEAASYPGNAPNA